LNIGSLHTGKDVIDRINDLSLKCFPEIICNNIKTEACRVFVILLVGGATSCFLYDFVLLRNAEIGVIFNETMARVVSLVDLTITKRKKCFTVDAAID
jgi:hypothetical protein